VEAALKSIGGRVEAFYFAFGDHDVYVIMDAPDNISVAAASMAIGASGAVNTKTVVLLTPEEIDQAAKKQATYTPPGPLNDRGVAHSYDCRPRARQTLWRRRGG
jgi:hypothetical protein